MVPTKCPLSPAGNQCNFPPPYWVQPNSPNATLSAGIAQVLTICKYVGFCSYAQNNPPCKQALRCSTALNFDMTVALTKEWGNKLFPKPYSGHLFCHSYLHVKCLWRTYMLWHGAKCIQLVHTRPFVPKQMPIEKGATIKPMYLNINIIISSS